MLNNFKHLNLKSYFSNKTSLSLTILALLVNIVIWILLILKIDNQAQTVFLHYTIYFGVDLIGSWIKIYIIPLIGLLIILINFLFGVYVQNKFKELNYFIVGSSLALNLFLLLHVLLLLYQNLPL